jgi:hypothetical protein
MVNTCLNKLKKKMIGHKLGEFSYKKVGKKITIPNVVKKGKIKRNTNNGSFGKCHRLNSFRISRKWVHIRYRH